LKKIEIYMQRRGDIPVLDILKQFHGDTTKEDVLAHIWNLIEELKGRQWELPLIPKLSLQHDLPRFTVPNHTDSVNYIAPQPTMKILVDENNQSLPIIPHHDSIEYFILQETISDTMELFEVNRKDCAKYLLGIQYNFQPKFFKSSDEEDMETDNNNWVLPDLLVEAIFSQMLRLPTPPVRQVFYSCVFIELCRADSASFPMALGRGVKTLFDRLSLMDTECIHRLWCWFSHHLSNFGFQWDWKSWENVLSLDPNHPQACFIRETLEKETRLSYYERIKSIIPPNFQPLIPAVAPSPNFEYKDVNNPLHEKAKHIIESLRTKKSVEEVRDILATYKKELESQGQTEAEQTQHVRQMFVQCLLLVGSKSFSHILNVVERYLDVLRFVNTTPEGRLHTVQIVASFWKNNTQVKHIYIYIYISSFGSSFLSS
jgi:nuclear cap-binding protein subunit 1